jgi:hypothetical protein
MNRTDIAHQVSLTLGDHTEDFDIGPHRAVDGR